MWSFGFRLKKSCFVFGTWKSLTKVKENWFWKKCLWVFGRLTRQYVLCWFPSAASLLLKKYHGGYVVIRMALTGHKQANRPFYRIVAAFNKKARDGRFLEQLGTYDPLPNVYNEKIVGLNYDRIKYWIGCGAHPTKSVCKLLGVYSGCWTCITA